MSIDVYVLHSAFQQIFRANPAHQMLNTHQIQNRQNFGKAMVASSRTPTYYDHMEQTSRQAVATSKNQNHKHIFSNAGWKRLIP